MGFDEPDLSFVIHYQAPGSVVAYYQQVGRAGRALDAAFGVLLSGEEETDITDYFIESAFPSRDEARTVLDALAREPEGLSVPQLLGRVNISKGRVEKTLALLSLESPAPIAKQGAKWRLTAANLSDEFWERADRLTTLRRDEQRQMQQCVSLTDGHVAFRIQALDGDPGEVSTPALPRLPETSDPALVREAIAFLRGASLPIEPREMWASGGLPISGLKGRIPPEHRAEAGRALSVWGDAGWGGLVREGKYRDGRFSGDLVEACGQLVLDWNPQPAARWVTCVPSLRHPELVADFARRLATRLALPFEPSLAKIAERPEQKTMANSAQQARTIDGAFEIANRPYDGPVLLVDDMVDSRWTMTVAAWLLTTHGSGPVFPLALTLTGPGE